MPEILSVLSYPSWQGWVMLGLFAYFGYRFISEGGTGGTSYANHEMLKYRAMTSTTAFSCWQAAHGDPIYYEGLLYQAGLPERRIRWLMS